MIWCLILEILFLINSIKCSFLATIQVNENVHYYQPLLDIEKLLKDKKIISTNEKPGKYKIYSLTDKSSSFYLIDNKLSLNSIIDRESICQDLAITHNSDSSLDVSSRYLTRNSCKGDECCTIFSFQVDLGNRISSYYILIKIIDQNDNIPKFVSFTNPYATIMENSPINTIVPLPIAVDSDSESFGIKRYTISKPFLVGNHSHFMIMDKLVSGKPQMILLTTLDREVTPEYRFTLKAVDREIEDFRENPGVEVEIKIGDINDNAPIFDKTFYSASITEHSKMMNVISFYITDLDEGQNKFVTVTIEAENEIKVNEIKNLFQVEFSPSSMSGSVRLIDEIDYEKHATKYSFNLLARDNGRPSLSSSSKVMIQVLNKNDHAPVIKVIRKGELVSRSITIFENEPSKTIIASLQVSDSDSRTADIECQIDDTNLNFEISPSNEIHPLGLYKEFIINTLKPLDREDENNQYLQIKIHCSDQDKLNSLSTNFTIVVTLNDINDNPPIFTRSKYQGELLENIQQGLVKMTEPIQTHDKDHGKNAGVIFQMDTSKNSTDWQYFTIDPDSGKIFSKNSIDYEKNQSFSFNIVAIDKDQSNLSSTAQIIVHIIDANDNTPVFGLPHYTFSVKENVPINTYIGQIETSDLDSRPENKFVRYFHKSYTTNNQVIHVDQNTGKVRTIGPIDREKIRTLSFLITARNEANYQNKNLMDPECMVVITIEDENDNPPVFSLVSPSSSVVTFTINKHFKHENCQLIPYTVSDADHDASSSDNCCTLQLDNDYDGSIYLLPNTPNLLCLKNTVSAPQRYQIFLTATDNKHHGNKKLQAKVSFSVIVKNEMMESQNSEKNENKIVLSKNQYSNSSLSLIIIIIVVVIVCILIITFVSLIFYRYLAFNTGDEHNIYEKNSEMSAAQIIDKNVTQMKMCANNPQQNIWIPEDLRLIPNFMSEVKDNSTWSRSIKKNDWTTDKSLFQSHIPDSYQLLNTSDKILTRPPNMGYEALSLVTSAGHEYFSVDGKDINSINTMPCSPKSLENMTANSIPNYKDNDMKYCQTSFV